MLRFSIKTAAPLHTLLMIAAFAAAAPNAGAAPPALAFRIDEGQNLNSFVRQGPVAAHLLLRSGTEPRILVAFPAGNSGIGLWFEKTQRAVTWELVAPPRPIEIKDERQRPLYGIEFEVQADAAELRPAGAVLSSIRVLRDFELQRKAPPEVLVEARSGEDRVVWARDRLDGAAGFVLSVEAGAGVQLSTARFAGTPLRLKIRALSGEKPLTPLDSILTAGAGRDARARDALSFLSYHEKFLAGSWRFDTYFGRDTLISALLLAPVLEPEALESAITSVLDRLATNGEVAHEEDIGEFAVLRNAREGRGRIDTPIYDYGMVDDDFLLAPLAARWLLDDARGRARAGKFLAEHGAALVRNLAWAVERAQPFADAPRATNLVGIKPGRMTGNWRDSEQGLGRGRYPYDVNAALVPAALDAAARLMESGLLDPHLDASQRRTLANARARERVWSAKAPALFFVKTAVGQARAAVAAYAKEAGVAGDAALRSLNGAPLSFHALSLDEQGRPVPILNSDEGFRLLLTNPAPDELASSVAAVMRPFPAGLMSDVGLLVANPALARADLRAEFSRYAYHGTVVWSWQQALFAAGLDRQLKRRELPAPLRAQLERARSDLWAVIERSAAMRTSELWSWSYGGGQYRLEPFGRPGADADESNAAQLWSTVYLGLAIPGGLATKDTSPGN